MMHPRSLSGRPKSQQKRQNILQAAKTLFLQYGYDGSSMDAIAREADVSKLTVYNHFKDKAHLFAAAIEMVSDQRLPKSYYLLSPEYDVEMTLQRLGNAFLTMLYSEEAIKMTQLMFSLIGTNPMLVSIFYHAGPDRTRKNMYQLFADIQQQQCLNIDNIQQSAELFISLMTDSYYDRVIWGIYPIPSAKDIDAQVRQHVLLFLKIYPKPTLV